MEPNESATATTTTVPSSWCPLLVLPDALFCRVLHFLPAEQKLDLVSYLCRRLTPISPVAFHHSHLYLSMFAVRDRPPHLLVPPPAFGVHSLAVDLSIRYRNDTSSYAALTQLLAPPVPSVISRFSSLRQLCLRLRLESCHVFSHSSLLSTLVPSSAALPFLERLTVWNFDAPAVLREHVTRPDFRLDLSLALSRLPSIRHLTLCLPLHTNDYAAILSLPSIHTINLRSPRFQNYLIMPQSLLVILPSLLSPSCRTLQLPRLNNDLPDTPEDGPSTIESVEPAKSLMEQIREQAPRRAVGLQFLAV